MQNFQFDLCNLNLLQAFDHEEFRLFCSKNGKQSNHQLIINEKLDTIIQTATKIKQHNLNHLDQDKVFHETKKNKVCPTWAFSQYKFFTYVIYLYSYIRRVDLVDLTPEDLNIVNQYFPDKPFSFITFQFKYLQKIKKEKWTNIEDELLTQTIKRINPKAQKISWKIIAYQIFVGSDMKMFRTYKQCRERWSNHLNPTVNRNEWTLEEDQKLFHLVNREGKKWSKLVQKMNSTRTQHMIKNRYNSYLRKWRRVVPNKRQDYYLQEIINYLTSLNQKDQLNYFNTITSKQVSFQQKKSKTSRRGGLNKTPRKEKSDSQSEQSVKEEQSVSVKMQDQEQIIQQIKQSSEEQLQVKHQEAQMANYNYFEEVIKAQNAVEQKVECIPEYMVMLEGRTEVNLINGLPEHVQNYLQKDPEYIKMVDDTWLTQLQERQNMKWLEWLQE